MAKGWKRLFAFLLTFFILILSSCQSTSKILTFALPDSVQQYYIRSTEIKDKNFKADIDFTIHVKNGSIYDPVTINYTVKKLPTDLQYFNDVTVQFLINDSVYNVFDNTIIMKKVDPVEFRYSSKLAPQDFVELVNNSDVIKIQFVINNTSITSVNNEINESIANFNIILD